MKLKLRIRKLNKNFNLFFTKASREPIVYLGKVFRLIMLLALSISFVFFIIVVIKALNLGIYASDEKSIKEHLIISLELLFLAPLPFVIIGAFYYYFRVQIEPDLNPGILDKNQRETILYANYFLNLSKLLFVATLISLLATKLVEVIDFKDLTNIKKLNYQVIVVYFGILGILIFFYYILEKGISTTYKHLENLSKDVQK